MLDNLLMSIKYIILQICTYFCFDFRNTKIEIYIIIKSQI